MPTKKKDSLKAIVRDVAKGGPDTNPKGPRWSHIEWSTGPKPWCHCVMCRARRILKGDK